MCTKKCARAYRSSGEHPAFPAQWFDGARSGYGGVFGSETVRPWAETLADLPCRAIGVQFVGRIEADLSAVARRAIGGRRRGTEEVENSFRKGAHSRSD